METFKHLIVALLGIVALTVLVHAQSQSGFISLDCGLLQTSGYTDETTGIDYTSDVNFTETGVSFNISSEYNGDTLEQPFKTVRSFPSGIKNCYTIKLTRPNVKYLIRASFMYGNYDGKSEPPRFDLLLEADVWDTIEFVNASTIVTKEILHLPQRNYVHVCLINTYSGTPFISSVELRPLSNLTYTTQSGSLLLHSRLDVGSNSSKQIRYKDDIYDRIWTPYSRSDWKQISTSLPVNPDIMYQQPSAVMRTAVIPADGCDHLTYRVCTDNADQYHAYMHFAELQQDQVDNQPRQLYIYAGGKLSYDVPYVPSYLDSSIAYTSANGSNLDFSINKTQNSALPPILNAIEIYREKEFLQPLTDQQDVDAITSIKKQYDVRSNWQGDPCSPDVHSWQGLKCFYDDYSPPRIISLNLSSRGISGPISPHISSLTKLEVLDLSNNNLRGPVPNFLSQLAYLKEINLERNQLRGVVPAELIERKDDGLLNLSVEGNSDLSPSRKKEKDFRKDVLPIVATVIPAVNLLGTLATIWILKTRNKAGIPRSQQSVKTLGDLASGEYTEGDNLNGDETRDGGPDNAMITEEKGTYRASSKLTTRPDDGESGTAHEENGKDRDSDSRRRPVNRKGNANPKKGNKRTDSRSKDPNNPELEEGDPYDSTFIEGITTGDQQSRLPQQHFGDIEDGLNISNLDVSREDDINNPTTNEEEIKSAEAPRFSKPQSSSPLDPLDNGSDSYKKSNLPCSKGKQMRRNKGKAQLSSEGNSTNRIRALFGYVTNFVSSGDATMDSSTQESSDKVASSSCLNCGLAFNTRGEEENNSAGSSKPQYSLPHVNPGDVFPSQKGQNLPCNNKGKAPLPSKGNSANPVRALLDYVSKCVSSDPAAKPVDSFTQESLDKATSSTFSSAASAVPYSNLMLDTIKEGNNSSTSDRNSRSKIHGLSNQMANLRQGLKAKEKEIEELKAQPARLEAEVNNASNKGYKLAQQEIIPNQPNINPSFMSVPLDKKEVDNMQKKKETTASTGHPLTEKDGTFDFLKPNTEGDKEEELLTDDQEAITPEGDDPLTNA